MLDKYRNLQPVFYNLVMSSFNNDKVSHAYLIETKNVSYSYDLALDLAKFFLCGGVFDQKICDAIDNNSFGDFKVVDSEKEIKKEEILSLKNDFSLVGNGNRRVYLLPDAEKLNGYAANSLLKFLEEPEDGVVAILLANNVDRVIETIGSRCQIINLLVDDNFDYKSIFSYYNSDTDGDYNDFIKREYDLLFDFYVNLEKSSFDFLVNYDCYSFISKIKSLLLFGLCLYRDVISYKLETDKRYLIDLDLEEIAQKNEIGGIIKKIDVIDEFLYKDSFNVNLNLFMDNFVISMKGVKR